MNTAEDIPVEVRARVEATALFAALQTGDYASAARAQERLRSLGWHVTREPSPRQRVSRGKSQPEGIGREVPAR